MKKKVEDGRSWKMEEGRRTGERWKKREDGRSGKMDEEDDEEGRKKLEKDREWRQPGLGKVRAP